jgi:hypothetical protein
MAAFFADAERKDLLQVPEATDNVFRLSVVYRFDVALVVLRLSNFPVWIVKQSLTRRGSGQNLLPPGRKGMRRTPTKL